MRALLTATDGSGAWGAETASRLGYLRVTSKHERGIDQKVPADENHGT
jgi:hypothetical protein